MTIIRPNIGRPASQPRCPLRVVEFVRIGLNMAAMLKAARVNLMAELLQSGED
jgi:hypothetical protein